MQGSYNDYDIDLIYKIVLIGDSGVGKSNLITRFTRDEFNIENRTTIGVEFATKVIQHKDQIIKMQIWDTAGQERYRAITTAYYKGAVGAIIVFDISRQNTFDNIPKWMYDIKNGADNDIVVLLVGNKNDLERQVDHDQAKKFASSEGIEYIETSAMTSENVENSFHTLIEKIYKHRKHTFGDSSRKNSIKKDSARRDSKKKLSDGSRISLKKTQNDDKSKNKDNKCC